MTKAKTNAFWEKIAKGREDNEPVGSAKVIGYAVKEAWFASFEEGRKYPLTLGENL